MMSKQSFVVWWFGIVSFLLIPGILDARPFYVNARSVVLLDMSDGRVLFEQNADTRIPPASVTKILSLYLVFDAVREGRIQLSDNVPVGGRAASTTGSRMHVRAGQVIPLEELIKGMAVVSGNDACIAVAEYMSGSAEEFVRIMNQKARELGMDNTHFVNPNGLPADGQYTTARDIAKLSVAYLHRFPDSLNLHSMRSYTFNRITHRNANRLLGQCPGVDGIKTGFVCAAGYNISATARRGNVRLLAVVLGAPSAGVRAAEATKLLERGFQSVASGASEIQVVQEDGAPDEIDPAGAGERVGRSKISKKIKIVRVAKTGRSARAGKHLKHVKSSKVSRHARALQAQEARKTAKAAKSKRTPVTNSAKACKNNEPEERAVAAKSSKALKKPQVSIKAPSPKQAKVSKKSEESKKPVLAKTNGKSSASDKQKHSTASSKKNGTPPKPHPHAQDSKEKKG